MNLIASVQRGAAAAGVAARIQALGGRIESLVGTRSGEARAGGFIHFSMTPAVLDAAQDGLRQLPLRALAERGRFVSAGEETSAAVETGVFAGGRRPYVEAGIDGRSQIIGISDTGLSLDAAVLADGVAGQPGTAAANPAGLAHRKVVAYVAAGELPGNGGGGDLLSCDGTAGATHGHLVASLAAGNASELLADIRTLDGFDPERDGARTRHAVDGVAPGARIFFIDNQVAGQCTGDGILAQRPGRLTAHLEAAGDFHATHAAALGQELRIHNFSFSIFDSQVSYTVEAQALDAFLVDNQEWLVVAAAGNEGIDADANGVLDFGSITSPGTAKNVLTVGSSGEPNDTLDVRDALIPLVPNRGVDLIPRNGIDVPPVGKASSQGPAAFTVSPGGAPAWRIKPDVMAPGGEVVVNLRLPAPTTCASGDDDQDGPVECVRQAPGPGPGTSFAAAAASGAAALVRDYFARGFAPAGRPGGPARSLSGPELKAALVASAEVMAGNPDWGVLSLLERAQFFSPRHLTRPTPEQGYGRINLLRLLPLESDPRTPSLISVATLQVPLAGRQERVVRVLNETEEVRIVAAWYDLEAEQAGLGKPGALVRDVDLWVTDCGADGACDTGDDVSYLGNFFSEDVNFDRVLLDIPEQHFCSNVPSWNCDPDNFNPLASCGDAEATCDFGAPAASEDCDQDGVLDVSPFSLPVDPETTACQGRQRDSSNNVEAVFLSPDPDGDGDGSDSQLRQGRMLRVRLSWAGTSESEPPASFPVALVVTGGIGGLTQENAVRMAKGELSCRDTLSFSVLDVGGDATAASVGSSVRVRALAADGRLLDEITGVDVQDADGDAATPGSRFESERLAVLVAPVPGRGRPVPPLFPGRGRGPHGRVLAVVPDATVEVVYEDAISVPPPPVAGASAVVRCSPQLEVQRQSRRGTDGRFRLQGGCDPRPRLDPRARLFGFVPGSGQVVAGDNFLDAGESVLYSIFVRNTKDATPLQEATARLRACRAGTLEEDGRCAVDPRITIPEPVQRLPALSPGRGQSVSFPVQVGAEVAFPDQIEMVLEVSSERDGLPVANRTVFHHVLDVDAFDDPELGPAADGVYRYSSDFPTGGREIRVNAAELFDPANPELAAEVFVFQDATATGAGLLGNATLLGFDAAGGRFDRALANNWPWTFDLDDEGFGSRRAPFSDAGSNAELAARPVWQWNNTGECGFQSNAPGQVDGEGGTGGIWHTGHALSQPGTPEGRTGYDLGCEDYDVPGRPDIQRQMVLDALSSPIFQRVHVGSDANGFAYTLNFTRLAFNVQSDIADRNAIFAVELDPDADKVSPVDPLDFGWLASEQGFAGFLTQVSGGPYQVFNPNDPHAASSATAVGLSLQETGGDQNIGAVHGPGGTGSFFDPADFNKAPARSFSEVTGVLTGRGFGRPGRRGAGGLPLRNFELLLDGLEGGSLTFEDLFGRHEHRDPDQALPVTAAEPERLLGRRDRFQVHFIALLREDLNRHIPASASYGWGVDDVVVEWMESHPVPDRTPCSDPSTWHPEGEGAVAVRPELAGGCASIAFDRSTLTAPESSLALTVVDRNAQFGPDGVDQAAGEPASDDQAEDTDGDGLAELQVLVTSDSDPAGEWVRLVQTAPGSPVYRGVLATSASQGLTSPADGVLFVQANGDGSSPVAVSAAYTDQDINVAGAGKAVPCPDNPLVATALTDFATADVLFVAARVTDEGPGGDSDGIADDGETIRLDVMLINQTRDEVLDFGISNTLAFGDFPAPPLLARARKVDLRDVVLTLTSRSPAVACILDGVASFGDLPVGVPRENLPEDPFRIVIGEVGRTSVEQLLQAEFTLGIRATLVDRSGTERQVGGFRTPQRFALNLDLDLVPAGGDPAAGPLRPLASDLACVGGEAAGRACAGPGDCPGEQQPGVPATCDPLPAYLASGGHVLLGGEVGYFEGFEGAANMAGRNFTVGPWPFPIQGTRFVHSPAVNASGGYLDGGNLGNSLDLQPGPLSPGASPGNAPDIPEGSSAVDGLRCQYNDPRGPRKHPRSENGCRPWHGSDWHVYDSKAFSGDRALRFGANGVEDLGLDPSFDTYHTNALAAAFSPPVQVGVGGGATLSLRHIIQAADDRTFSIPNRMAADRGYLEVQELDPVTGEAVRGWIKLDGFQNNYDKAAVVPFFTNCIFDGYDEFYDARAALGDTPGFNPDATSPVGVTYNADDVGSEDDYFDPNDPLRLFGPSSGCFPEFVFAAMGDYTSTDPQRFQDIGLPWESGSTGTGVWAHSLFSLDAFAGRTIRLRFVLTSIDIGPGFTWADLFGNALGNATRGWVIDDVAVTGLVDRPAVLVPDRRPPGAPVCPVDPDPATPENEAACGQVVADAGPDQVSELPGDEVVLDGGGSRADACVNGLLLYRWRHGQETLQEFSGSPVFRDTPVARTTYTLDVRCSTDPACADSDSVTVAVRSRPPGSLPRSGQ